ncbi:MAG: response regulator [Pseudomonadota bacterium]|nr:response regulator [Pseudomonadota bacterium]
MSVARLAEGRKVLVVEDQMVVVLIIEEALVGLGADIVGPVAHVTAALELARDAPLDAAVLDVNIRDGNTCAVADVLAKRAIPFVFCSGYSDWALEERHRGRPRLSKPYTPEALQEGLIQLLSAPGG